MPDQDLTGGAAEQRQKGTAHGDAETHEQPPDDDDEQQVAGPHHQNGTLLARSGRRVRGVSSNGAGSSAKESLAAAQ